MTFHISHELYGIDFQTNTEDFQSHGNKFANDFFTCENFTFFLIVLSTDPLKAFCSNEILLELNLLAYPTQLKARKNF